MKLQWLVAKYMSDLRRREPVNVGVILLTGGRPLYRFSGQRDDGTIDGRSISWARSIDSYKDWVDYWAHHLDVEGPPDMAELMSTEPDANFYLERGGERVFGSENTDPSEMLEDLYELLVDRAPRTGSLSVSKASERLFGRLKIADRIMRPWRYEVANDAAEKGRTISMRDTVQFDFRFDHDDIFLMQGLTLTLADNRSWETLHATLWNIERAQSSPIDPQRKQKYIALVRARETDSELVQQLGLLEERAPVVRVDREDEAIVRLRELLHLDEAAE